MAAEPETVATSSAEREDGLTGLPTDDGEIDGRPDEADIDRIEERARQRVAATVAEAEHSGWFGVWMLFRKELERFWNVAGQTIVSPVVTTLLYFLVFGVTFKGQKMVEGVPYIDFLVPGLVMLTLINNSFINSAFSFFITKIHGIIVDILVTPLGPLELTIGYTAASIVRGLIVGGMIWLIAAVMGAGTLHAPLVTVGFMITTSLAFASLGLMIAIVAEDFDHINLLPNFLITPLTFLGGVFYSIEMLPAPWDTVSRFNPVLYVVNGIRWGMTGHSDVPLWQGVAVVGAMCVGFTAGAIWMLATGKKIRE